LIVDQYHSGTGEGAKLYGTALPRLAWYAALTMVVWCSVIRGGNRYVALQLLEVFAFTVLTGLIWRLYTAPDCLRALGQGFRKWALITLLAAPVWVGLLQLLPLPFGLWSALPSRTDLAALIAALQNDALTFLPLSLAPEATRASLLAGLPVVACLALGIFGTQRQTGVLLRVWVGAALLQASLGLLQMGPFPALYFGLESNELVGTFASKNTYSNFLVMTLPLVVWRLSAHSGKGYNADRRFQWLWGLTMFTLLAALLAAGSRTGIATGLLVTTLAVAMLSFQTSGRWGGLPTAGWVLLALLLLALLAGGVDWVARFDGDLLVADDALRGLNRRSAWKGVEFFGPLGAGLGSFATVFPRFQAPELGRHLVDLAHSDYLQLMMDLGVFALPLGAAALGLVLNRAWGMAQARRSTKGWAATDQLAVACGLGALATALHAWVDYPFHIPANAMLAAFLLGVFLREPTPAQASQQK